MSKISGLRTFFKAFFKSNESVGTSVVGAIPKKNAGDRLWQNDDIRVDRGETLSDGTVNIVWQRQSQTKEPALKKIKNTHTKILVQNIDPKDPPSDKQFKDNVLGEI